MYFKGFLKYDFGNIQSRKISKKFNESDNGPENLVTNGMKFIGVAKKTFIAVSKNVNHSKLHCKSIARKTDFSHKRKLSVANSLCHSLDNFSSARVDEKIDNGNEITWHDRTFGPNWNSVETRLQSDFHTLRFFLASRHRGSFLEIKVTGRVDRGWLRGLTRDSEFSACLFSAVFCQYLAQYDLNPLYVFTSPCWGWYSHREPRSTPIPRMFRVRLYVRGCSRWRRKRRESRTHWRTRYQLIYSRKVAIADIGRLQSCGHAYATIASPREPVQPV